MELNLINPPFPNDAVNFAPARRSRMIGREVVNLGSPLASRSDGRSSPGFEKKRFSMVGPHSTARRVASRTMLSAHMAMHVWSPGVLAPGQLSQPAGSPPSVSHGAAPASRWMVGGKKRGRAAAGCCAAMLAGDDKLTVSRRYGVFFSGIVPVSVAFFSNRTWNFQDVVGCLFKLD